METDPLTHEALQTPEEYAAELHRELESLKRRSDYIIQLLRKVDPVVERREAFIDDFYKGE